MVSLVFGNLSSSDQHELQNVYARLFRLITIYEDYEASLKSTTNLNETLEKASPREPKLGLDQSTNEASGFQR